MTTMKLEVEKALLAREILNTDNYELLKELSKAYNRIKTLPTTSHPTQLDVTSPDVGISISHVYILYNSRKK